MNYFLKYKFVVWTVIILLVMVVTVVGTMVYMRYAHRPENWGKRGPDRLWQDLKLTPKQDSLFNASRGDFFKSSKPIFDSLEVERQKMLAEFSKPNPDTAILYTVADNMGKLHTQMKRNTIVHLLKLRGYCNPEQVEILKKINGRLIGSEGPRRPRIDSGKPFNNNAKPQEDKLRKRD
jgi:hypothetical protein